MADQNLTIFQRLTKVFGFGGQPQAPSFNFSKEELLRTDDPSKFEKEKLERQQSQYLFDK